MVLNQEMQPVTTEKYLPFQLSRARFASVFGSQIEPLVLTGSAQEEVSVSLSQGVSWVKCHPCTGLVRRFFSTLIRDLF